MEIKELIEIQQEVEEASIGYVNSLIENNENSSETHGQDFQNGALWMLTNFLEKSIKLCDSEKAKKWDDLMQAVGVIYDHDDDEGGDLLDVGEIAASHLGYL